MKKIKFTLLLVVLALCTGLTAHAQFAFGPKIGMNFNEFHISGTKMFDTNNRCGFTGGIAAEYTMPIIGIGAELSVMYTYQTSEVEVEDDVLGVTKKNVHGNFIEIPLHLKYKLSIPAISQILSPYIFTGPSVSLKLGGNDSYFDTKKTQWGWDLGLGIQLIRHLQIGAGYTFGINKLASIVVPDVYGQPSHEIKVKNNYWTVTAAWMF